MVIVLTGFIRRKKKIYENNNYLDLLGFMLKSSRFVELTKKKKRTKKSPENWQITGNCTLCGVHVNTGE